MTDDSSARNQSAMLSGVGADYDAIHAAIVATERGRWFLEEYARRNRAADTDVVLAAIERIEQTLRGGPAAEPAHDLRLPDVAAMVEAIGKARSDAVGRHGDPAAIGDAALADFRNAVEQIQELMWDMHGRDAASEYGSQLSLQTNRLTSAGDRIENSFGGLRILLALIDDLEQRLHALAGAPVIAAPSPVAETPFVETPTVEPPSETGGAADGHSGAKQLGPILSVVEPEINWSRAFETPAPEPVPERLSAEDDRREPERAVAAVQFEPLWPAPDAPSEPAAGAAEDVDEPVPASRRACDTEEPAPIAHVEASLPPLPDVMAEPQVSPAEPPAPPIESRAYGHWHETATVVSPPEAEDAALPPAETPPQPERADPDETVADTAPVQDQLAEFVAEEAAELSAWPVETSGAVSSSIEWFEVPAADASNLETAFDADLFDNDDKPGAVADGAGELVIDALQAGETIADEPQPAVNNAAAEDIEWLTADNNAGAVSAPAEPAGAAAPPNEIDALFADAPQPDDEPARPALADLDDLSAETSALPGSAGDGLPPQESAAAASLYADASYSEPPPSMSAYASRAYAQHTDAPAGRTETPPPAAAYQWPATFARETTESAEAPEPEAGASGPFAEESPDVPSVIERLESVRSAIAALMDEVSETGPRRTGTSRS